MIFILSSILWGPINSFPQLVAHTITPTPSGYLLTRIWDFFVFSTYPLAQPYGTFSVAFKCNVLEIVFIYFITRDILFSQEILSQNWVLYDV